MTEPNCAPVGPMLDALGMRVHLDEGQHLVEAILIAKVIDIRASPREGTSMVIGTSEGLDWVAQRGLLAAARDVLVADILHADPE